MSYNAYDGWIGDNDGNQWVDGYCRTKTYDLPSDISDYSLILITA